MKLQPKLMKNTVLFTCFMLLSGLFGYGQQEKATINPGSQAKIVVYFFHGTHRCSGCINAEKATVTVLKELYKSQLNQGIIRFQSINVEETQNKALAEKYEAAWNMLLIVPVTNEKAKVELTEQAFAYGTNPEGLKPYIKKAIDPLLK